MDASRNQLLSEEKGEKRVMDNSLDIGLISPPIVQIGGTVGIVASVGTVSGVRDRVDQ